MDVDYKEKYGPIADQTEWKPLLKKKGLPYKSHTLIKDENRITLQPKTLLVANSILFSILLKLFIASMLLCALVLFLIIYLAATGEGYLLNTILNLPFFSTLIGCVVVAGCFSIRSMPKRVIFDTRRGVFSKGAIKNSTDNKNVTPLEQAYALQIICTHYIGKMSMQYWWINIRNAILYIIQKCFYAKSGEKYAQIKQKYMQLEQTIYEFIEPDSVRDDNQENWLGRPKKNDLYRYELNLVLQDGSRINVLKHQERQSICDDAYAIHAHIGKPVWDESLGKVVY